MNQGHTRHDSFFLIPNKVQIATTTQMIWEKLSEEKEDTKGKPRSKCFFLQGKGKGMVSELMKGMNECKGGANECKKGMNAVKKGTNELKKGMS